MKIGLFFGSFNPVHTGHLIIANYMVDYTELDKIWFVISPQNPFKLNEKLLNQNSRLNLLKLAIADNPLFEVNDIEFNLPVPSFTDITLDKIRENYPEHEFTLIIGGDNLQSFHKWNNYQTILQNHQVFVYARTGIVETPLLANHPKIKMFEVPLLNISSTYIRETIKANKSIKYLVPNTVLACIKTEGFYSV